MAFALPFLFAVLSGHALSTDTFTNFVDFHSDACPSCLTEESESSLKNPCCSLCDCNVHTCKKYGTCCLGMFTSFEAAYESVSESMYTCVDPNIYAYDVTARYSLRGKRLISRCKSSTTDPKIKDFCENPNVDKGLDTLIPVTDYDGVDSNSGVYYRNQYCVLCGNQTRFDKIKRWDMYIGCEEDLSYTYENMYQIFKERTCNVTFVSDFALSPRSCVPYEIETCNVTGRWKEYNETIERACHSFIDPYNFTYKNVFCFLCNEDNTVPVDLWQCQQMSTSNDTAKGSVAAVNVPFRAMLDLSAVVMTQSAVQLQCNEHTQFTDEKLGVCRDIQCDDTGYLYFDGSCALKSKYENPLCYMMSFKLSHTTNGEFIPRNMAEGVINSVKEVNLGEWRVEFLDVEVYIKESESDNNLVEYFIFNGLTDNVTIAGNILIAFENDISYSAAALNMLLEVVAYNITYFNDQYIHELPRIQLEPFHDTLVKLENEGESNKCFNKTLVFTRKLIQCPFVQLKLAELDINITNGYLFFQEINTTVFSWSEYKLNNDSVFLCLSDYKRIYANLPKRSIRTIEIPMFLNEVSLKNLLSLICVCMSIVCLLLTMVMLIFIPEFHTHPGLNTLILCICLLVAQTVYQFGVGQANLPDWLCKMLGAVSHLSWLSVMFSMNVCSLDMFLIFRKLRVVRFDSPSRKVLQRVVYILTLSLLFLVINISVSLSISEGNDVGYGGTICYISSRNMQIVTFIVPSVLTIVTNIVLYIFVVFKIGKNSIRSAGLNQERNYFGIYARLSTLTGFTWIVGFALLLVPNEVLEYVFIILNASQGIFIMMAFVLNRRLLNQCMEKITALRSETRSTRISK